MKALARQGMLDGAVGLSTGLFYVPGNYADTEEVIEIARVVGAMGGFHQSHMRDETEHSGFGSRDDSDWRRGRFADAGNAS